MSAFDLLVFDCDGVLLDSVAVKTDTFGKLFEHLGPEAVDYVKDHHLRHGGVSRYAKFEHYFQKFMGRSISAEESAALDRRFNEIALEQLLITPPIAGAREFLETHQGEWPMYVASGAPDRDLRIILEKMGLAPYFRGIHGSPTPKAELLAMIVDQEEADPRRTLMIGDSNTDLDAANAVGTRFLGVGEFPPPHPWMPDLTGLYDFLTEDD